MKLGDVAEVIKSGKRVQCTAEEYVLVRTYLHKMAMRFIEISWHTHATHALEEIDRLDKEFGITPDVQEAMGI